MATYQNGFDSFITQFKDPRDGNTYNAVALDTDDYYYLVNIDSLLMSERRNSIQAEIVDAEDVGEDVADVESYDDSSIDHDNIADDSFDEDTDDLED